MKFVNDVFWPGLVSGSLYVPMVGMLSRRTQLGRQLTAVAQDPDGAASIGISVVTTSRIVMAMSGVIAALTGFLAAPSLQVAPVALGLPLLFNGFVAAAIGGIGNLHGSLVGLRSASSSSSRAPTSAPTTSTRRSSERCSSCT